MNFFDYLSAPESWLHASIVGLSFAVVIRTLEELCLFARGEGADFLDWNVIEPDSRCVNIRYLRVFLPLMGNRIFVCVLVIQLASAVWLILFQTDGLGVQLALLSFVLGHAYQETRATFGLDGAHQMSLLISICLFIASLADPQSIAFLACVWYICIQCIASYFLAGIAKCHGAAWRDGTAVTLIMGADTYGNVSFGEWLRKYPIVGRTLSYETILFELTFPAVLFLPFPGMLCLLLVGFCFHLGTAVFMGLNNFMFTFVAAYPSVIFCWYSIWG